MSTTSSAQVNCTGSMWTLYFYGTTNCTGIADLAGTATNANTCTTITSLATGVTYYGKIACLTHANVAIFFQPSLFALVVLATMISIYHLI